MNLPGATALLPPLADTVVHSDFHSRVLPSATEMAELDRLTIESGVPSIELMERAGTKLADVFHRYLGERGVSPQGGVVLCGPGNNGGDGLVVARKWSDAGVQPNLFVVSSKRYSEDFKVNLARLHEKEIPFRYLFRTPDGCDSTDAACSQSEFVEILKKAPCVVDALLGTGQESAPRGEIGELLSVISDIHSQETESRIPIFLSVDIPTGVNGSTGEVYSPAFRADFTGSVQFIKRGMLQFPAKEFCGRIETVDIGIDGSLSVEFQILDATSAPMLPERSPSSHKGALGHVLVVAGSRDMPGASVLSALGALRSGAGLVTQTISSGQSGSNVPVEVLRLSVPSSGDGAFGEASRESIVSKLSDMTALVLGPGLSQADGVKNFVHELLSEAEQLQLPVVLDADGLNALGDLKNCSLKGKLTHTVLTPHPGEAARLLGCSTEEVQRDRFTAVRELAQLSGGVVVLKGAGTVIYGDNNGLSNISGNQYMATPGSGDVLAGMIAAFIGQLGSLSEAAVLGVFLHGVAGDLAWKKNGWGPLIASDIVDQIPYAVGEYTHGAVE